MGAENPLIPLVIGAVHAVDAVTTTFADLVVQHVRAQRTLTLDSLTAIQAIVAQHYGGTSHEALTSVMYRAVLEQKLLAGWAAVQRFSQLYRFIVGPAVAAQLDELADQYFDELDRHDANVAALEQMNAPVVAGGAKEEPVLSLMAATDNAKVKRAWQRYRNSAFQKANYAWVTGDQHTLSSRVWNLGADQQKAIRKQLTESIRTGDSPATLATKLEQYLKPEFAPTKYLSNGKIVKKNVSTGGGSYAARRLARTELTKTNGEWTATLVKDTPGALGTKWNLSGSHPGIDVCDQHAKFVGPAKETGGLPGVYPKSQPPQYPAHPQCLCYLTPAMKSRAQVLEDLKNQYPTLKLPPPTAAQPSAPSAPNPTGTTSEAMQHAQQGYAKAKSLNKTMIAPDEIFSGVRPVQSLYSPNSFIGKGNLLEDLSKYGGLGQNGLTDVEQEFSDWFYKLTTQSTSKITMDADFISFGKPLSRQTIEKHLGQPISPSAVRMIKYKDKYYVLEGDHRVATALIRGEKALKVELFDADELIAKSKLTADVPYAGPGSPGYQTPAQKMADAKAKLAAKQASLQSQATGTTTTTTTKATAKKATAKKFTSTEFDKFASTTYTRQFKAALAAQPDGAEMLSALTAYKDGAYSEMNNLLRKGQLRYSSGSRTPAQYDRLNQMVAKSFDSAPPIGRPLTVYRGTSSDTVFREFSQLNAGDTVVDTGFVSTSTSTKVAHSSFGGGGYSSSSTLMTIDLPADARGVWLDTIAPPREKELLLNKDATFIVKKIEKTSRQIHVFLEYVPT